MEACQNCGQPHRTHKRRHAKYCSTRCRVAAHRKQGLQPLKQHARWVNHDQRKRPINPNTGHMAKSNDYTTWGTYTQAQQTGKPLGYMLGDGIGCIDLDHCIQADGTLTKGAQLLVAEYPENYIEVSPSGTGLHIWGTAAERKGFRTVWKGQAVEFYSRSRYITVTGKVWQAGRLAPL